MAANSKLPQPLPDELIELIAQRFRVIGEPTRIKLLNAMREAGSASVQELIEAVGASQQNISKHLQVLHQVGIVSREKEGNFVRYSIADDSVFALCDQVCGGIQRGLDRLTTTLQQSAA